MTREEALKVANEMRHWLKTDREKEALETLIPELKESEDERIIKTLQEYVKNRNWPLNGPTQDEALAYLERQKEQKSLNISAASEWLREHVCTYMNSEYNEFHKCVEYDGSIDKERLINDFEEAMQKEQKPVWSEEDKEWLSEVYFAIDHSMYSEDEKWGMKNYIDSLRSKVKAVINTPERVEAPGKKFMVRCKTEKKDNLWFDKGDERPAYAIDNGFGGFTYLVCLREDGKGNRVAYMEKSSFLNNFEIIDNQ